MLTITEIYTSIQGESTYAGLPCIFVRLTGCNLRCRWCDTAYAHKGGRDYTVEEVLNEVARLGGRLVELTGGEPLLQPEGFTLATQLADNGYRTLVETNGSMDIRSLDPRVIRIIDVKCPGSGEYGSFLLSNLQALQPHDELKFVIAERTDFDWALDFIRSHGLEGKATILISPVHGRLVPEQLAAWLLESGLQARLQVQLQKYLWPCRSRGV